MHRRFRPNPAITFLLFVLAALPCSLSKRPIWAKNPRSSTALFRVVVDGKAGYIDRSGRMAIAPQFSPRYIDIDDGDFVAGIARVWPTAGVDHLFIDESGRTVEATGLELAQHLSEGLAPFAEPSSKPFKIGDKRMHTPRRGFVDGTGKVVIPLKYAYAGAFSEGFAAVALDGNCWVQGWSDSRIPAPSAKTVFTSCGPEPDRSVTAPCRHGYIDKSGRMAIPARFELAREFSEGRAAVRMNGKWGYIDREGREEVSPRFEAVGPFSEGWAAVKLGKQWGYIDAQGQWLIEPRFEDALPFSNGLAAVKTGDRYRFIDAAGRAAIDGPYLQATPFVQGLAHVQLEPALWAWIDATGKVVFRYEWKQEF